MRILKLKIKNYVVVISVSILFGCAGIDNYKANVDIVNLPSTVQKIQKELSEKIIINSKNINIQGSNSNIELYGVAVGDVVKVIYGKALNVPYVVSQDVERLDNKIDICIKKKISHDELLIAIKQALNMVGVQVVEKNGVHYLSIPKEKETFDKDEKKIIYIKTLKYISPAVLMPVLEKVLIGAFPSFTWSASAASGFMVCQSRAEDMRKIIKIIDDSDIEEKQIFVEVMILECVREGLLSNGLMAYLSFSVQGLKAAFSLGLPSAISGLSQMSLITNADTFSNILGILQTDKIIKNIASPYLVMRSGKNSSLSMGDEIPVLSSTTTSTSGSQEQSIVYRKTGVTLDLLPFVIGNSIYLDISISTSSGQINKLSNINSPSISNRSFKSSLKLENNEAVLLGGITINNLSFSQSGLPIDNSIIKNYINQNDRSNNQTELLVFLRPIIINNNIDFLLNEKQLSIIQSLKKKDLK